MAISFHYGNQVGIMENCNIINNSSPGGSYAVVYNGGSSTDYNYCCFINNLNKLMIIVTYGNVNIRHSFIKHDGLIGISGKFINVTYDILTLNLIHLKSNYCFAEIPFGDEFSESKKKYVIWVLFSFFKFFILKN